MVIHINKLDGSGVNAPGQNGGFTPKWDVKRVVLACRMKV